MSFFQKEDQIISALKQNFPKADKFQIVDKSAIDEAQPHYASDIIRLTFKYEEDGIQSEKSLICKVPIKGDLSSLANGWNLYTRESFMYETMIPRMNDYLDEPLTPSHIKTADSSIVILENLTAQGYKIETDNRVLCGRKQCYAIVEALAYFHATSHQVGQMEPHLLEHKLLCSTPIILETRHSATHFWEPILIELLARNNASHFIPKLRYALLPLKRDGNDVTLKIQYSNFKFFVLNHGDFRKDNTILKYGPRDTVDGVKILDLQTCFWTTPVYDFMYFILQSSDVELIENHFDTLVNWYLECLNKKLAQMNCIKTYNRLDFDQDIKTLDFCCILLILWSNFVLAPLDEMDRSRLLRGIFQGKTDDLQHFKEVFIDDEILTKKVLSALKLCENLGLFEA